MEDTLKQIGERLKGLRDIFNISPEEIAQLCDISLEHYFKIEEGKADPSFYRLSKIAKRYNIGVDALLFGEEAHMSSYFVTRKGKGKSVEHHKNYTYESLATAFRGRKIDPFLVTIDPLEGDLRHHQNTHTGQEFDYVLEGTLEIVIGNKELILNVGDSIYFDAQQPHCMRALGNEPVRFLCMVI